MKFGKGSPRRTPWWCWLAMILMAAMMLPGTAFVASAKDKSKRDRQAKRRDAAVQASPNVNKSRVFRQKYRVADLLEEIQSTLKMDDDQARGFLIERIKNVSEVQWDDAKRLGIDFDFGDGESIAVDYIVLQDGHTSVLYWSGTKLIAIQTKTGHARLASALERIRKNGLDQIKFEMHTIIAPPELVNSLSSNWITPQSNVSQGDANIDQQIPRLNRPLPDKNAKQRSTARMSVEKNLPVMLEVLDTDRRREILDKLQQHAKANVIRAPKVTVFSGQSAVLQDGEQRPFVVGFVDGKPQLQVVSTGWKLHLRPILRGKNLVWLDYEMTLSNNRSVGQTVIRTNGSDKTVTLQIPEVAKTQIDSSVEVPLGKTLLVGGLKTTDVNDETRSLLVLLRATKVDPDEITAASRTKRMMFGIEDQSSAALPRPWHLKDDVHYLTPSSESKPIKKDAAPSGHTITRVTAGREATDAKPEPADAEVMKLLEKRVAAESGGTSKKRGLQLSNVRIVKERIADYTGPPRVVPLIGPVQPHHAHFKCTVNFVKSVKVGWPIEHKKTKDCVEVFYIDVTHFHMVGHLAPSADEVDATARNKRDLHGKLNKMRRTTFVSSIAAADRIKRQLNTPIALNHDETPLKVVVKQIGKAADLNLVLDTRGLAAEGVTADQPITINLGKPIRISSALNLILDPLQLKYQIEHEVVRITSKTATDEDVYPKTYYVADLVVPVPKTVRLDEPKRGVPEKTEPEFESLIKLIQSTIAPETWDEAGGPGAIASFDANLSLVISQTPEVHEEIADLLRQIRRLQDVSVTCELRTFCMPQKTFDQLWDKPWTKKSKVLSESEMFSVLQMLNEHKKVESFGTPKITLSNGQQLDSPLDYRQSGKSAFSKRLHLSHIVSSDRRSVRLQLAVASSAKEFTQNNESYTVNEDSALLVDITDQLFTLGDKRRAKTLVSITPRIFVNEEEEEAYQSDPPKLRQLFER